jgi:cobalt/nickel transport protein
VALAFAVFVSPFVSSSPDGLEKVAADKGFQAAASEEPAWSFSPIPDYAFPGIANPAVATAVAGGVGTISLFVLVFGLGRLFARKRTVQRPEGEQTPRDSSPRGPGPQTLGGSAGQS